MEALSVDRRVRWTFCQTESCLSLTGLLVLLFGGGDLLLRLSYREGNRRWR